MTMEDVVAIGRRKHLDFCLEKKVLFFLLHYSLSTSRRVRSRLKMISSSYQSSLTSNMAFLLGLVFLCLIHRVEPSNKTLDFSSPLWYPSNLFRFTRPTTSSRLINRPIPLLYDGSSIHTILRPFNPFRHIDVQNKTDIFVPIFVTTTTTPTTTTSTLTTIHSILRPFNPSSRIDVQNQTDIFVPIFATTTSTPITTPSIPATTILITPTNPTTLPQQIVKFCNPTAPPACVDKRFGFCISDDEYPDDDIKLATEFSELADSLSFKPIGDDESIGPLVNPSNDTGCVTTSVIAKPLRARNIDGDWRIIVQDARDIFQRQQMVLCGNPDASCHNSERITPVFCFNGKCRQTFAVRRLLAFDPCNPEREVFVDSFKLPSECSCRLSRMPCVYKYDV